MIKYIKIDDMWIADCPEGTRDDPAILSALQEWLTENLPKRHAMISTYDIILFSEIDLMLYLVAWSGRRQRCA